MPSFVLARKGTAEVAQAFIRRMRSITRSGFSIIKKWPPSGTYSIV